ncbi:hypothetical protein QBC39DRAFT_263089 [Podospora conica]|nr:hypothetical protein QBC39DRAFT_263089 [Schizothecium conicum]
MDSPHHFPIQHPPQYSPQYQTQPHPYASSFQVTQVEHIGIRRSPSGFTRPSSRPSSRSSPTADLPPEYSAYSTSPSGRENLRDTARVTQNVLPPLLAKLNRTDDARRSSKHTLSSPLRLDPAQCPRLPYPARILVVNDDTLNAAIKHCPASDLPHPAVINFADRERPGGGWLNGAMAQEESLCYRSSLSVSLESSRRVGHYPLSGSEAEALYAPWVVVLRGDLATGHRLLLNASGVSGDITDPRDLPVVSVLTVPAIKRPRLRKVGNLDGGWKWVFQRDRDRTFTKDKMRLVLRMAAAYGHRHLVLGALGCGVYANPPEDVAWCWLEVMREEEFRGNWWKTVVFAVYDPKNEGNFEIFNRVLGGQRV